MFTVSKMLQLRLLSKYYAVLKVKNRTRKWSFVSISRHLEHVITHAKSTRERDCLRHTDSLFVVILLRLLKISLLLFSGLIFFFSFPGVQCRSPLRVLANTKTGEVFEGICSIHFQNTFNLCTSFTARYAILLKYSALTSDPGFRTISGFENRCRFMTFLSFLKLLWWRRGKFWINFEWCKQHTLDVLIGEGHVVE